MLNRITSYNVCYTKLLRDYPLYIKCREYVEQVWRDADKWDKMAILNVARIGKFSSDRSIREYCEKIWKLT